ncbi:TPA: fimbrial protein [Enterobacter soli]|nr:fimbrial protein [Enterobacter soli]
MTKINVFRLILVIWPLALTTAGMQTANATDNLQIRGVLVNEPCVLDPTENTLTVDFKTVIKKGLYKETRTPAFPFTIRLTDCDTSIGKDVMLTLSGDESTALPGLLTTHGSGSAGIAIGIEMPDKTPIAVNKATAAYALQDDVTEIHLQAFVEAEPDAIKNQTLVAGDFSATATINASYP